MKPLRSLLKPDHIKSNILGGCILLAEISLTSTLAVAFWLNGLATEIQPPNSLENTLTKNRIIYLASQRNSQYYLKSGIS